jgi:hypothetical protein
MALDPTLVVPKRLSALPASGAFVGEIVVLSGTGVIYRWQGASWVADGSGGGGGVSDGTYGDITVTSSGTVWTIGAAKVTLAKMANLATATFIGRVTGSTGVPEALTGTQATTLLDVFTSALKGLVPASGGGTTNFLRADGTWAAPSASVAATTVEVNLSAVATWRGRFTITDAAISSTSKVLCWQAPGPYTGKGTLADEAEAQPVSVISVTPATGSAVVTWETPPMLVTVPRAQMGQSIPITNYPKDPQAIAMGPAFRRGKVRGNVKFSYAVFA